MNSNIIKFLFTSVVVSTRFWFDWNNHIRCHSAFCTIFIIDTTKHQLTWVHLCGMGHQHVYQIYIYPTPWDVCVYDHSISPWIKVFYSYVFLVVELFSNLKYVCSWTFGPFMKHWIELVTMRLINVQFIFSTEIFYRVVPGFAIDKSWGVWLSGLTICLLYVIQFLVT